MITWLAFWGADLLKPTHLLTNCRRWIGSDFWVLPYLTPSWLACHDHGTQAVYWHEAQNDKGTPAVLQGPADGIVLWNDNWWYTIMIIIVYLTISDIYIRHYKALTTQTYSVTISQFSCPWCRPQWYWSLFTHFSQDRLKARNARRKNKREYYQEIVRPDGTRGWQGMKDLPLSAHYTAYFCRALCNMWAALYISRHSTPMADEWA